MRPLLLTIIVALTGCAGLIWFGHMLSGHYLLPAFLILFCLPMFTLVDVQDGIARGYGWMNVALVPPYILRPLLLLAAMAGVYAAGQEMSAVNAAGAAIFACWGAAMFQSWQLARHVGADMDNGPRAYQTGLWISTALPLLFPAVRVGNAWYGDGGLRLTAPLSSAIHLGATSIFVISTRYGRSRREADEPVVVGYPPAAQIMGLLMNAIFLDMLDQDAHNMRLINDVVRNLPPQQRDGLRPIKLFVLRPSVDLGKLAGEYEFKVGGALRLLTRGLGTSDTKGSDWLSMLLFQDEYVDRLVQIGWEDGRRQHHQIPLPRRSLLQEFPAAKKQGDHGEYENVQHIGAQHVSHRQLGIGRVQSHCGYYGGKLGQRRSQGDQDAAHKHAAQPGQRSQGVTVFGQAHAEVPHRHSAGQKNQYRDG